MERRTIAIEVNSEIQWEVTRTASGGWVAVCDALGLTTGVEGDSLSELMEMIDEACGLLFCDLLRDNELEQFLRVHGWQAVNLPTSPDEEVAFDVPWNLVAARQPHGTTSQPH